MNPYYDAPEDTGLTIVAWIEYSDMDYVFDTRVVWRHTDGKLYTARDSGCSCPTPFEDYTSLDKLEQFNYASLRTECYDMLSPGSSHPTAEDVRVFLNKIRGLR